jgi:glycosyltransferase involved in cell wall biosynthesis
MELEQQHGFRSSFNFVPEGEYVVSAELRGALRNNGFEVGVHDLHHDGMLFRDRQQFAVNAARINKHLNDWGAVGFRSGFTLHNLEWLHDLNVSYDASTFDTDPFEPQPQGQNTIFPFWVSAPRQAHDTLSPHSARRRGYVELPYTLPQDSTLFLILGERRSDIWIRKLDWIAEHGGMALLNVHPDYLGFNGEPHSLRTYPARLYEEFLQHVRARYGNAMWHPLPREMASYAANLKPPAPRKPRRICMVTYSHYCSDARVMRYAEALGERGDSVEVLSLQGAGETLRHENIGNVRVHRLQEREGRAGTTRLSYAFSIFQFLIRSSLWIARQHNRKPFDLLHIHNMPDFLVFAGAYARLRGAKTILDIHDILPEFYVSKFSANDGSIGTKLLKWVEKAAAQQSDHVIISNHLWRSKYATRTGTGDKCTVFVNYVDTRIFYSRPRTRSDDRIILIFPGGFYWHQGLDIAIRAFQRIADRVPQAELHLYGDGNMKDSLMSLSRELRLDRRILFFGRIPVHEIAGVMANADIGVVPKRADSFGNEAYSTKIMEFMSIGLPVVASSTKIDRYYFDDSIVRFFKSGDVEAMADAILDVLADQKKRQEMVRRASAHAQRNNWESLKSDYVSLVESLCIHGNGAARRSEPSKTNASTTCD